MNIAVAPAVRPMVSAPEGREGPGPDRVADNDADDGASKLAPSAPPAGMGRLLDRSV